MEDLKPLFRLQQFAPTNSNSFIFHVSFTEYTSIKLYNLTNLYFEDLVLINFRETDVPFHFEQAL